MGHRTLKRVPMNFNWPMGKVWKGYINDQKGPDQCPECEGTGQNAATRQLEKDYYDNDGFGSRWGYIYGVVPDGTVASRPPWKIVGECRSWEHNITQEEVEALIDNGRLCEFVKIWDSEANRWVPRTWKTEGLWCPNCLNSVPLMFESQSHVCQKCQHEMQVLAGDDRRLFIPSAEVINKWSHEGFGHDTINRWILVKTRAKRLGIWGKCPICRGHGELKLPRKLKKAYKNWKEYDPPSGDGWQLWETCSEGSPISPVFASAEELAEWCEEYATTFANYKSTKEEWYKMFTGKEMSLEAGTLMVWRDDFQGALIQLVEQGR